MRMLRIPGGVRRLILLGLTGMVPVVNLFSLGYLGCFVGQVRQTGRLDYPVCPDMRELFRQGLRLLVPFCVFYLLPMAVGRAILWILGHLPLVGSLLPEPYAGICFSVAMTFAGPLLVLAAVLLMRGESPGFAELPRWLEVAAQSAQLLRAAWLPLVVPAFLFAVIEVVLPGWARLFFFFPFLLLLWAFELAVFAALDRQHGDSHQY